MKTISAILWYALTSLQNSNVHYKSMIFFRIRWLFQTNIASSHQVRKKLFFSIPAINISNCRCKRKFFKCQAHADFIVQYAQARLFRHLANEHNFWNRSTFLKKHQISSRSLKESFCIMKKSINFNNCTLACVPTLNIPMVNVDFEYDQF